MSNIIEARVKQKKDTLPNWEANPMILLDGEQAFVVGDSGQPINFKIGNGTKRFSELPYWIDYSQGQYIELSGNALPTPTVDVGYTFVGPGTYTFAGQPDIVAPDGRFSQLVWDGSNWSLKDMGALPMQPIGVPGGAAAYESVEDIQQRIGSENQTFGSKNDNVSQSGQLSLTKYIFNGPLSGLNGLVKEISIFHGTAPVGSALNLVHGRKNPTTQKMEILNTISKTTTATNALASYTIPDWDVQVGDSIGFEGNVAGLCKYSSTDNPNFKGFILVTSDGTIHSDSANFAQRELSLSFTVTPVSQVSINEQLATINANQIGQSVDIDRINRALGDLPISENRVYKIGVEEKLGTTTSQSATYRYYLNKYSYNEDGLVKRVNIWNTTVLPVGDTFTIVQMRYESVGNKYVLINSIVLNVASQDSQNTYNLPNWEYKAGDQLGIISDAKNGVTFFDSNGGNGVIPVTTTGTYTTLATARLSMSFDIEVSFVAPTVAERLNTLEENGGGTPGGDSNYLPRPSSGVVNFQVDVNKRIADSETNSLAVQDDAEILKDWGVLLLPTNYDPNGKPLRLIICCHGTGTYINGSASAGTITASSFWLSQGYAMLDMNGLPDGIIGNGGTTEAVRHYGSPYALQSYIKGYQYAVEKYNLYKDVFVYGVSMGGLSSFMLVQSNSIPVIAQGGFCPCIDLYKQAYSYPWHGATQRSNIAQLFGFSGTPPTFTATRPPTAPEIAYFKANRHKVVGYDNMLKNVSNVTDINSLYDDFTEATEAPKYNALKKFHPVPLKIWHNVDDDTVLYKYSQYYVNMVRNNGGLAFLRSFPSGNHNAWLNGDMKTGIPTISGGTISVQASMYECMLWFRRFEK